MPDPLPDPVPHHYPLRPARDGLSEESRYRWAIASRAVAAGLGGYALSALFCASAGLALVNLGSSRPDAVMIATMSAFVVHALAVLWAFRADSVRKVWLGMAVLAGLFGGAAALMGWTP